MPASHTILIFMHPEPSAVTATAKLAHALTKRGDKVVYVTVPDLEDFAKDLGLCVETLFTKKFPRGSHQHFINPLSTANSTKSTFPESEDAISANFLSGLWQRFTDRKRSVEEVQTFVRRDLLEEIAALIQRTGASLALVDGIMPGAAVACRKAGVATVTIINSPADRPNLDIPPSVTPIIPSGTAISMLQTWWAWKKIVVRRYLQSRISAIVFGECDVTKLLKDDIEKLGLSVIQGDESPRIDLPEVVFMPRAFEFDRIPENPLRYYMAASSEINRNEKSFDWSLLPPQRPMLICSLGTYTDYPGMMDFFRTVIEAMRIRSNWTAVVNIGNRLKPSDFRHVPENVVLSAGLPQLALLRRAALMITQSGMQTLRECVGIGVPMICFPAVADQPGVAARVVFHGLGVRSDVTTITPQILSNLIQEVGETPHFRQRVEKMREKFLDEESFERGVDFVRSFAQHRPIHSESL